WTRLTSILASAGKVGRRRPRSTMTVRRSCGSSIAEKSSMSWSCFSETVMPPRLMVNGVVRAEQPFEEGFVSGLHVGLARADISGLQALAQGDVHRRHALRTGAFDDVADGGNVAAADGAAEGVVGEQDFVNSHASAGDFFAEELGNDASEAAREEDAHLILFIGREGVDD